MVIADSNGLPVAISIHEARTQEIKLVENNNIKMLCTNKAKGIDWSHGL